MFKHVVLSMALMVALGSVAEAGGGSKSNGSIRVTNTSSTKIGLVAVNPSDSLKAATNASEFTARGGKILNPGESTEFKNLRTGSHTVATALVDPETTSVDVSSFTVKNVSVAKGKRTQINL
ncbi:hypothetical protein [Stieleria mannarensis]|uniref:hypothetical protein n=1 Tax=Stieleria mannarensis TaxID=2755585 RepID=UPI001601C93D|nr:hypothetical protein [Rhodopirellula sp. JC639]